MTLRVLMALSFCFLLGGCQRERQEGNVESSTRAQNKAGADEVILTAKAQAEQKIEVAPVKIGVALFPQRARGRIVLPDNATWRVGVLAEGRVEKVYFNLGDSVKKGQVLARMHSHDVHDARAAYANAMSEQSRLQAAAALAEKNYERSLRLYELKAESVAQTEIAQQEVTNAKSALREADNNVRRETSHITEILGVQLDPAGGGGEAADLIPIRAPADGVILQKTVTPGAPSHS